MTKELRYASLALGGMVVCTYAWVMVLAEELKSTGDVRINLLAFNGRSAGNAKPSTEATHISNVPPIPSLERALEGFALNARVEGIQIGKVSIGTDAGVARGLTRTVLSVQLRGSYGGMKQLIASLLSRHPNVYVQQLSLRRGGPGADANHVDGTVEFVELSRSAAPAGLR